MDEATRIKLQRAADAAKIPVRLIEGFGYCIGTGPSIIKQWWNPLVDDGDALRLAMALSINLNMEDCSAYTRLNDSSNALIEAFWGGDYDPDIKVAIVEVACQL